MSDVLARNASGILRITLNRPETGNKVSDEMVVELTRLIAGVGEHENLIVLRGAGEDFCLGRGSKATSKASEALERRQSSEVVFDLYRAIRNAKVPVVCGIQGQAVGFGCAIAAISDIAVAAEDARFSTPEMEHGILPTVVLSTLIDRVPRKAINFLI
jgi:enoyl-CoA hydratase